MGKPVVLLEKFSVAEWFRAITTYRMTRTAVQPAVIRMILDADIPREDLSSLEFIAGGSGPLDPYTRDEFERRYRIPVLWAYGVTEFAGSLCAWTPDLYRENGSDKRDSVGRPLPGTSVRIVDADSDAEVAQGSPGLPQGRIPVIGPDWIRTTDLTSVDADGFVRLHGRADGAINRGGSKIMPETVRRVCDIPVCAMPVSRVSKTDVSARSRSPSSKPCRERPPPMRRSSTIMLLSRLRDIKCRWRSASSVGCPGTTRQRSVSATLRRSTRGCRDDW